MRTITRISSWKNYNNGTVIQLEEEKDAFTSHINYLVAFPGFQCLSPSNFTFRALYSAFWMLVI
jgi:hypothetical protein